MLAVRRSMLALLAVGCGIMLVAVGAGAVDAQTPPSSPPSTQPRTVETPPERDAVVSSPTTTAPPTGLIPVPAGCPQPPQPTVVFVGTVVESDTTTARFRLQQVRAGSAERFVRAGLIDVEYGIDTKYLEEGGQYLVGAGINRDAGLLTSKVRPDQPLFGGNDVAGVAESDVDCPVVEDGVRTLTVTGRSIESGVLEPLEEARGDLLRAIVIPVVVAFAIIVGLASLRWIFTGMAHGASSAVRHTRERNHPREVPPYDE